MKIETRSLVTFYRVYQGFEPHAFIGIVVWFLVQANFGKWPGSPRKHCLLQKLSKMTIKSKILLYFHQSSKQIQVTQCSSDCYRITLKCCVRFYATFTKFCPNLRYTRQKKKQPLSLLNSISIISSPPISVTLRRSKNTKWRKMSFFYKTNEKKLLCHQKKKKKKYIPLQYRDVILLFKYVRSSSSCNVIISRLYPGVNFIKVFMHSLYVRRSQNCTKESQVKQLFALLGSAKTLMKLTPYPSYFQRGLFFSKFLLREQSQTNFFGIFEIVLI